MLLRLEESIQLTLQLLTPSGQVLLWPPGLTISTDTDPSVGTLCSELLLGLAGTVQPSIMVCWLSMPNPTFTFSQVSFPHSTSAPTPSSLNEHLPLFQLELPLNPFQAPDSQLGQPWCSRNICDQAGASLCIIAQHTGAYWVTIVYSPPHKHNHLF